MLHNYDRSVYSETSNNGLSEGRTTSVRTKSMPPIALPIEIVHWEPPRSGQLSTPPGQRIASVPPKDSSLYKIASESGQRPKPQAQITRIISRFGHLLLRWSVHSFVLSILARSERV